MGVILVFACFKPLQHQRALASSQSHCSRPSGQVAISSWSLLWAVLGRLASRGSSIAAHLLIEGALR